LDAPANRFALEICFAPPLEAGELLAKLRGFRSADKQIFLLIRGLERHSSAWMTLPIGSD
jgi:hypothetical protein